MNEPTIIEGPYTINVDKDGYACPESEYTRANMLELSNCRLVCYQGAVYVCCDVVGMPPVCFKTVYACPLPTLG